MSTAAPLICKQCGSTDEPETVTPGSLLIEIILWLLFLPAGIIYSLWRHCARHEACTVCGSRNLIPLASPIGQQTAKGAAA